MTDIQNMAPDAGLETAGDTAAHALRKPSWIRVKAPVSAEYNRTRKLMRELRLNTAVSYTHLTLPTIYSV